MAILYRSNALSRGFEESLMRGRIPYVLVGDVEFYQRAEIKDTLSLLRLSATPDSTQGDEALRRVINVPPRGFGPKAIDALEQEAAWRQVSLLQALETAELPPKARSAGLALADAVRGVGRDRAATVADQISLLLEATGYRAMLRQSKAETTEDKLENIQELIGLAGGFHTARELLDHAALSSELQDESADRVRLMTMHKGKGLEFPHVFLPAWETGTLPPDYGVMLNCKASKYGDRPWSQVVGRHLSDFEWQPAKSGTRWGESGLITVRSSGRAAWQRGRLHGHVVARTPTKGSQPASQLQGEFLG